MGKRVSIYEKALLDALFLTLRNLAVPKLVVKQQSNNDVHGYDIYNNVYSYRRGLRRCSFRLQKQCQSFEEWDEQQD